MNAPYLKYAVIDDMHVATIIDPQAIPRGSSLGSGRAKTREKATILAQRLARSMGIEHVR